MYANEPLNQVLEPEATILPQTIEHRFSHLACGWNYIFLTHRNTKYAYLFLYTELTLHLYVVCTKALYHTTLDFRIAVYQFRFSSTDRIASDYCGVHISPTTLHRSGVSLWSSPTDSTIYYKLVVALTIFFYSLPLCNVSAPPIRYFMFLRRLY